MGITHLRGSLAQNISDITKGGGCPKIKPWNKKYSVLRYFSRMKDDTLPEITGVVGDGGLYQYSTGYLPSGSDNTYMSQYFYCANIALSGGLPFFHSVVDFPAPNNVLNICNQRELTDPTGYYNGGWINDSASNSICNIELANDVIDSLRDTLSQIPISQNTFPKLTNPFRKSILPTLGQTTNTNLTGQLPPVVLGADVVSVANSLYQNLVGGVNPQTTQLIQQSNALDSFIRGR